MAKKFNIEESAAKYKSLKQQAAQLEADAKKLVAPIITAMKKMKADKAEFENWKVTVVEGEDTTYDLDILKRALKPKDYRKCVKEVPDKDAILELVNRGVISTKLLAKAAIVTPKAPYILVNPRSGK